MDKILNQDFFVNYWQKKHRVFKNVGNTKLYDWRDLTNDLNRYPYLHGLQIIEGDDRWCLDKVRSGKMKKTMLSKAEVYEKWLENKTIVLPISEYLKEEFYNIVKEFEHYFDQGTVNIYCSPGANSKSFPAHADQTENFLFHSEGKVYWKIYEGFAPDKKGRVIDEFVLEPGDILYIPAFQYHEVETLEPRILISIHFNNKPGQTLEKFHISNTVTRPKWYDWDPSKL